MTFTYDDGGRKAAGYRGEAGDCVTRSLAIAMQRPYQEVHNELNLCAASERGTPSDPDRAVFCKRIWFKRYMADNGWLWTPTMRIGSGCTVHLNAAELPAGRLIVHVSRHSVAVIDGIIHDTSDPSRDGRRCVYGYWSKPYDTAEEATAAMAAHKRNCKP